VAKVRPYVEKQASAIPATSLLTYLQLSNFLLFAEQVIFSASSGTFVFFSENDPIKSSLKKK
jgi:hypothetical protein